nr:uncharacterized protein LOC113718100 [Coffea arabica]
MDLTKDPLPICSENKVSFDHVQASQIPSSQLKLQFLDVLFNPKYTIGADQFLKSSNNSVYLSASITDSSTITLHYEDYEGHHAVFSEEGIKTLRCIAATLSSRNELVDCVQMYTEHRKDVVNLVYVRLREKLKTRTGPAGRIRNQPGTRSNSDNPKSKSLHRCHLKKQELASLTQSAKDALKAVEESVRREFAAAKSMNSHLNASSQSPTRGVAEQPPDACQNRAKIVITIQDKDGPKQFRVFVDDKFERLFKMYADKVKLDLQNLVFCFDGVKLVLLPPLLGLKIEMEENDIIEQMTNILSTTEKQVLRELSTRPFPGGGIHPLTKPQGSNDDRDPPEVPGSQEMDKGLIPLKSHLARVIEFLLYNLKFKPNFYGQESLRCLFMMNNVSSVSEMIKSSKELEELIGTHLQMKLREKVELAKTDYFHRSWGDIYTFLKGEGLKLHFNCDFFPGRSTRVVKKKFKTFNSMFEDILQTQERWIVPDQQLRMKLLECILAKLIPAYNHFLERLSRVHKVKRVSEYIKYSVKDLETKVLDMFQNKY